MLLMVKKSRTPGPPCRLPMLSEAFGPLFLFQQEQCAINAHKGGIMQAMNHLSTQAMISVSHELLNTNRAALDAQPELVIPLQLLDKAHTQLVTLYKTQGLTKQVAQQLTAELSEADARHDRKARG